MNVSTATALVCIANGVVCFAVGYFATNHRVTFAGPAVEVEKPAPSPYAFEGQGWTIKIINPGIGLPNIYELTSVDGVRFVALGGHLLQPMPKKTE